jgi:hypothetical protein
MYYLINNNSDLPLAQQIAICDTTVYLKTAKEWADRRKAQTGNNWSVIKIDDVYTTQTFDEAHMEALDVPHMARD